MFFPKKREISFQSSCWRSWPRLVIWVFSVLLAVVSNARVLKWAHYVAFFMASGLKIERYPFSACLPSVPPLLGIGTCSPWETPPSAGRTIIQIPIIESIRTSWRIYVYCHSGKCHLAGKTNELGFHGSTWRDLKNIILNEKRQIANIAYNSVYVN